MTIYTWILIFVFGISYLLFIAMATKREYEYSKINKKYFSKDNLIEYERLLEKYLKENSISTKSSLDTIVKKLQYEVLTSSNIPKKEAIIEDPNSRVIRVNEQLSLRQKNFAVAHELGHIIRGNKRPAARNRHTMFSVRPAEEQICDYIGAAILLPQKELYKKLIDHNYDEMTSNQKTQFINLIADQKNVSVTVVQRRIHEVKKINI